MKSRLLTITGLIIGIIFALGPLWGMAFTSIFMVKSFNELGKNGIGDPTQLSNDIGHTLISTVIGFVACPLGLVLTVISLIFLVMSYRSSPPPLPEQPIQG